MTPTECPKSQIDTQFGGAKYDFGQVWQRQSVSEVTLNALLEVAHAAQLHLTDDERPQAVSYTHLTLPTKRIV